MFGPIEPDGPIFGPYSGENVGPIFDQHFGPDGPSGALVGPSGALFGAVGGPWRPLRAPPCAGLAPRAPHGAILVHFWPAPFLGAFLAYFWGPHPILPLYVWEFFSSAPPAGSDQKVQTPPLPF